MNIQVIAIGKTDSQELRSLIGGYENRLQHYVRFELVTLPDVKNAKHMRQEQQKQKEGEALLKMLTATDVLVLLDEKGTMLDSVDFSSYLQKKMNAGVKRLVFAIGGPYGFSSELYKRANGKISLSKMTFSHQMVRLFLLEQLYRAFTILRNEPYHHR